jgi:hypothetical protein
MPKNPPGRCIFCEQTGLTDEHLLPNKWMRQIYQRSASDTREWRTRSTAVPHGTQPVIQQGSIFSLRLHVACKKCNNGWMHNLEDAAAPLLLTLITGNPGQLKEYGQLLLSRWLVKTTMVAEYLGEPTFSQDHRRRMKEALEIPEGCQIWIGTTTGSRWHGRIEHRSSWDLSTPSRSFRLCERASH